MIMSDDLEELITELDSLIYKVEKYVYNMPLYQQDDIARSYSIAVKIMDILLEDYARILQELLELKTEITLKEVDNI